MSVLYNDWTALQLHRMRHEDRMRAAEQERLVRRAAQGKPKQAGAAGQIVKAMVVGLRRAQTRQQPAARCCAGRATA